VADIGAVLDALGWPQAHLVGMSFGGLIAAHFAASAPHRVSSLVTIDVGPGVAFEGTARTREFSSRPVPATAPKRWWRLPCKSVRRAIASASLAAWRL
jgi:pimeloyl-ACP methyl ester carboxylesterase